MLIKIFANRDYKKEYFGNEGTQNENRVTILTFEFPEELNEYNKRIVFLTPDGNKEDLIIDDSYIITNGIAKYEEVQAYVWLTNDKSQDFRSRLFNLKFYYNEQSDETEPTEEELDIYNTLITELNKTIDRVAEIEIDVGTMAELKERVDLIDVKIINIEEIIENINGRFDELSSDIDEVRVLAENNSSEINSINQELNNVDVEIERLSGNVNVIANDVSINKTEIRELEENQNYLEENKADKSEIPDVSEFIKKTVDDLINYYKKSETYTQAEVNQLIGQIKTISMKVLPERPEIGESNIIYLIPSPKTEPENIYDEWIYVNNKWELIGTTQIDLSNYYTRDEINTLLFDYITSNDLEKTLENYALKSEIPEIKIDENTIKKDNENKLQSVGSILKNGGFQNYWSGTKNEFNAIVEKDANTLYEVLDDEETALFEVDGNTIEFSEDNILQIPSKNDLMFQSITYGNHESGYRKWRNGYIEQWGVATSSANGDSEFTMHQPHIDQNFSVFIEPREQGNFFHYAIPSHIQKFRTRIQTRDSANIAVKFQWHSHGYWK